MIFGREPALVIGLIAVILSCAVGFGLNITTGQVALIMSVVYALASFITRSLVTPVNKV